MRTSILAIGLAAAIVGVLAAGAGRTGAAPHTGQSVNVLVIGGADVTNGGELVITGAAGGLGDFTFTELFSTTVDAAALSGKDTAVLNVASNDLDCDVDAIGASGQAALVTFVAAGGKLIIYDSECSPQDYSWLPFPFTTNNPGAQGAEGTLTIVEENLLSTAAAGSHFIDAANLGSESDAVGDMNVMTTFNPNWCLDMSGTNDTPVTGPVHAYARHGSGIIIYNGLDVDDMGDENSPPFPNGLEKIWLQELQLPLRPTQQDLPCGVTVVGITLTPQSDTNPVGTAHTVTATTTDLFGDPVEGNTITFTVTAGPNSGASGTCSPSAGCITGANGQVSFSYSGSGGAGTDTIVACFDSNQLETRLCSQPASKTWVTVAPPSGAEVGPPAATRTATAVPATPTAAPPTATPAVAVLPAIQAPDTGSGSAAGSDMGEVWLIVIALAAAGAATAGGGVLRIRRVR
jgi:hypothetical protein